MYLRLIYHQVLAYLPTDKTLALHRLQYAAPVMVIHKHPMQVLLSIGFRWSSNLRDLMIESDFNNTFYNKKSVPCDLSWSGGNRCKITQIFSFCLQGLLNFYFLFYNVFKLVDEILNGGLLVFEKMKLLPKFCFFRVRNIGHGS